MRIEILSECDSSTIEKVHEAFDRLLPQLSSSARPLSREEIQKLLTQECLHLVCALDNDDRILGMLSLVAEHGSKMSLPIRPHAVKAWDRALLIPQLSTLGSWELRQLISHLGRRERRRTASTVGLVSFSAKPTSTGSLSDPVRPVCGRWDSNRCPTFPV